MSKIADRTKKILLLVEDETFVRELYQDMLVRAGYTVEVAFDGEEALNLASKKEYDLILLDIMLPKLTGLEVLRQLKTPGSVSVNTPVYLLTNLGEDNISQEAYRLGAEGYLLKANYLPKDLVAEVDKFFIVDKDNGIEV
jgi:CheY-like chemotaxis protein